MQKKKISNGTLAAIIVLAIIIADQVIKIWVKTSFVYFLFKIRKNEAYPKSFVVCLSMVTAGAIGNVIDGMFYGLIFSESTWYSVATLFPEGGGYGTFLHGLVVDMFHFPLVQGTWPDWMPWVGGTDFEFFRPVFNLADAAISVGIVWLILFNSKYLSFSGIEKSEAGQHDGDQDAKQ